MCPVKVYTLLYKNTLKIIQLRRSAGYLCHVSQPFALRGISLLGTTTIFCAQLVIFNRLRNLICSTGFLWYAPEYVSLPGIFCFAPQSVALNWTTPSLLATAICCVQQDIFVRHHNLLRSTEYLCWPPQPVALNGISLLATTTCCAQQNIFVGHHNLLQSTECLC